MEGNQRHEWEHNAQVSCGSGSPKSCRALHIPHPMQTQAEPSGAQPAVVRSSRTTLDARFERTPSTEEIKTRRFEANACPATISSSLIVTTDAVSQESDSDDCRLSDQETCSDESQRFLSSLWLCLRKDPQQVFPLVGGMVVLIQRHIRQGQVFPLDHCRVAEVEEYGKFIVLPPEEFLSPIHAEQVTKANIFFVVRLLQCLIPEVECSQLSKCEIEELTKEPHQLLRQGYEKALQEIVGIMRRAMR